MKEFSFHIRDLQFHLGVWSQEKEQSVMLLHGLASTLRMFDLIAPPLADDYAVYMLDQRGHGQSAKPDAGYDFESIAADLDAVLDMLGLEQVNLVGHSWGAYTTLYYAATRPERVRKAVLVDGGLAKFSDRFPTWEEAEIAMSPPEYHQRSLSDIERMIQEDWLGAAFRPELAPLALSIFDTDDPSDVKPHLNRRNHMQIARVIWEFDPVEYYARVSAPVLIINAASNDPDTRTQQERYTQQAVEHLAQAQVQWMEDTIHDIPWHRPAELAAAISTFLGES